MTKHDPGERPLKAKGHATSPVFGLYVAAQHDPATAFWTGVKKDRKVRSLRLVFSEKDYKFDAELEDRNFLHDLATYLCGRAHGYDADADSPRCVTRLTPDEVAAILTADRDGTGSGVVAPKATEATAAAGIKKKMPFSPGPPVNPERIKLGKFAYERTKSNNPPLTSGRWTDKLIGEAWAQEHPDSALIPRGEDGKPKFKEFRVVVKNARQDYADTLPESA